MANTAIVCEGQLDLISAFEAGVQNVIAPQGTAFTTRCRPDCLAGSWNQSFFASTLTKRDGRGYRPVAPGPPECGLDVRLRRYRKEKTLIPSFAEGA